jgi:phosphoribosyl-AMP cyclohydrolase
VANAWAGGDELGLRLAAQDLARSVMSLVQPLNPRPPVRSRREALRTILDFDVVPVGYRDDMLTCMALADRHASPGQVHAAAGRLARGVLALLDAHTSAFATLLPPQAARCVHDGTLRRYIEQALGDPAAGPAPPG